jgi:hypothetical protein
MSQPTVSADINQNSAQEIFKDFRISRMCLRRDNCPFCEQVYFAIFCGAVNTPMVFLLRICNILATKQQKQFAGLFLNFQRCYIQ